MLCPEGQHVENIINIKEEDENCETKTIKDTLEGDVPGSMELASFKSPKTWKKSLSKFFRNQLRSTKSNDGDSAAGCPENFQEKELSPDQKWQSLGKIFRRQSLVEHEKSPNPQGESSSQCRRFAVRKVLSTVFGKTPKSSSNQMQTSNQMQDTSN